MASLALQRSSNTLYVFTLCTQAAYMLPPLCVCVWRKYTMFLIWMQTHTFGTLVTNARTPGPAGWHPVCNLNAGDTGLTIGVCDVRAGDRAEARFKRLPIHHPACTHQGEALVYRLGFIVATLETVYLVSHPIMPPNIWSSPRRWDKDGPGIFHTLL